MYVQPEHFQSREQTDVDPSLRAYTYAFLPRLHLFFLFSAHFSNILFFDLSVAHFETIFLCSHKNFSYTEFRVNSCSDNFILLLSYVYYLNIYKYLYIKVCIPLTCRLTLRGVCQCFSVSSSIRRLWRRSAFREGDDFYFPCTNPELKEFLSVSFAQCQKKRHAVLVDGRSDESADESVCQCSKSTSTCDASTLLSFRLSSSCPCFVLDC